MVALLAGGMYAAYELAKRYCKSRYFFIQEFGCCLLGKSRATPPLYRRTQRLRRQFIDHDCVIVARPLRRSES